METLFSFVSILLAFLFPGFLVAAIRTQDKEKSERYRLFSCLAFGIIVSTLIALL